MNRRSIWGLVVCACTPISVGSMGTGGQPPAAGGAGVGAVDSVGSDFGEAAMAGADATANGGRLDRAGSAGTSAPLGSGGMPDAAPGAGGEMPSVVDAGGTSDAAGASGVTNAGGSAPFGGATSEDAGAGGFSSSRPPPPVHIPPPPPDIVLAWEPCVITALASLSWQAFVGCSDGRAFATSDVVVPHWSRIDVTHTSVGDQHLPSRALTALLITDGGNEGALLAGLAQAEPGDAVLFSTSHNGAPGWLARGSGEVTGSVLGLSLVNDTPSSSLFQATTQSGSYSAREELNFSSWPPAVPLSAIAKISAGPLQGTWIGDDRGALFRLPEGQDPYHPEIWIPLLNAGLGAGRITFISEDPARPERIYVSAGAPAPGIYCTLDAGLSWRSAWLPALPTAAEISQVSVNPAYPNTLYAAALGSQVMPLRSDDGGETWTRNEGMPIGSSP